MRVLGFGEPLAHHLRVASNRNTHFAVHSLAGRFVLLCVAPDLAHADARAALELIAADKTPDGNRVVTLWCADPSFESDAAVQELSARKLVFHDGDRGALRELGLLDEKRDAAGRWILFDPTLRIVGFWPMKDGAAALASLASTPEPGEHAGALLNAPILIAPRIFEPAFCRQLVDYYNARGGMASGTTRESADGKTFVALDDDFKRRADCIIDDATLRQAAMHRIFWRLLPEIEKAFSYKATRMERYIVACYDGTSGGFFRPHRDNTTKGTAHRRFAVTLNLNAEEYDGGDLRFPEFGARTYRAPTGGAVVFSCSLLHEATPVTRGKRYAFLPFLYDDEAAKVREANNQFLDDSVREYRS